MHVFDFLELETLPDSPVWVIHGSEAYLRQLALQSLKQRLDPSGNALSAHPAEAQWRDVNDDLRTGSLFAPGSARIVLVDEAAGFVSAHRPRLEDYLDHPARQGILVLVVDKFPGNTRLAKRVKAVGQEVVCRAPVSGRDKLDEPRIVQWLTQRAAVHQISLPKNAAQGLLQLVGPEFGRLDQELARLALYTKPGGRVSLAMIEEYVLGGQTKTVWELLDLAMAGDSAAALAQLDRMMLHDGMAVPALLGAFSWYLKRFAAATRIYEQAQARGESLSLSEALTEAGFQHWGARKAETQLRHLGRRRAGELYQTLLQTDLASKSTHSSPARGLWLMERLLLELSQPK